MDRRLLLPNSYSRQCAQYDCNRNVQNLVATAPVHAPGRCRSSNSRRIAPTISHIAACSSMVRLKKSDTCRRGTTRVWPGVIGKLSVIAAATLSANSLSDVFDKHTGTASDFAVALVSSGVNVVLDLWTVLKSLPAEVMK